VWKSHCVGATLVGLAKQLHACQCAPVALVDKKLAGSAVEHPFRPHDSAVSGRVPQEEVVGTQVHVWPVARNV
jgi:hypothetical protein